MPGGVSGLGAWMFRGVSGLDWEALGMGRLSSCKLARSSSEGGRRIKRERCVYMCMYILIYFAIWLPHFVSQYRVGTVSDIPNTHSIYMYVHIYTYRK